LETFMGFKNQLRDACTGYGLSNVICNSILSFLSSVWHSFMEIRLGYSQFLYP
jgi:hypothetical protein